MSSVLFVCVPLAEKIVGYRRSASLKRFVSVDSKPAEPAEPLRQLQESVILAMQNLIDNGLSDDWDRVSIAVIDAVHAHAEQYGFSDRITFEVRSSGPKKSLEFIFRTSGQV